MNVIDCYIAAIESYSSAINSDKDTIDGYINAIGCFMWITHSYIENINTCTATITGYNDTMTGYKNKTDVYIRTKEIYRHAPPNPPFQGGCLCSTKK